jgi:hypothetical protein
MALSLSAMLAAYAGDGVAEPTGGVPKQTMGALTVYGSITVITGSGPVVIDQTSLAALIGGATIMTLARDPVAADIPDGTSRVVQDTRQNPSRISTWANVGGRVVDLGALAVATS